MNDIIESLYNRKSVRAFTDEKISPDIKKTILESAIMAPTAGNQTLYTIIDIESQAVKDKLAVLCDNQPFISAAPMVLVFVADCKKWYDIYGYASTPRRKPGFGDLMIACSDTIIAAQNSDVAAQSFGLGSCYIGDIMENKEGVSQLLNLDEFLFPISMVVYGYPTEQQKNRKKPTRFNLEEVVMKDRYTPPTEEQVREMLKDQSGKDNYNFDTEVDKFCKRKYMSDFALEMNRSVAEYFKDYMGG